MSFYLNIVCKNIVFDVGLTIVQDLQWILKGYNYSESVM